MKERIMNNSLILGLLCGLGIGATFAWLQWRAVARYEKDMEAGRLARLPGAAIRVALLLVGLVLVQFALPPASLWWVTAGLLTALVLPLSWRLRRMLEHR